MKASACGRCLDGFFIEVIKEAIVTDELFSIQAHNGTSLHVIPRNIPVCSSKAAELFPFIKTEGIFNLLPNYNN